MEARLEAFEGSNAVVLGTSCDGLYSHDARAYHHGLSYPLLLSDTHRTVCQASGTHNAERNRARWAVFIVDTHGVVRAKMASVPVSPLGTALASVPAFLTYPVPGERLALDT